ncbi:MAG TPA: patatin-like phospholipase family protein [Actinomycetales bacterium]|nr:patatin-like phospholipase family protein [Actinomycetales bacterium]
MLGVGGITGIAWELGLLAGLAERGLDLTTADVVIGTSAGSFVGAQIRGGVGLDELYAGQLRAPSASSADRIGRGVLLRLAVPYLWPRDERTARARVGRLALAATTVPEDERRRVIAAGLRSTSWPDRTLLVTAVDAQTGDAVAFSGAEQAPLVDAVAASCAVPLLWPPITVNGRRYVDGGVRSPVNADLAAGCDRVVVVAPVTIATRRAGRIRRQLASLGTDVRSVVVSPDDQAHEAIGRNVLDDTRRAVAARAGRAQAATVASRVAAVWDSH